MHYAKMPMQCTAIFTDVKMKILRLNELLFFFFFFFCSKHRLWVRVDLCFEQIHEKKNERNLLKIVILHPFKFAVYCIGMFA